MKIFIFGFSFLMLFTSGAVSHACAVLPKIPLGSKTGKVTVQYIENGKTETSSCSSADISIQTSANSFYLQKFETYDCGNGLIGSTHTAEVFLEPQGWVYFDFQKVSQPANVVCTDNSITLEHDNPGVWTDPWMLGHTKWEIKVSGKKSTLKWIHYADPVQMIVTTELKNQ